jgi:hypothetical protein
MKSKIIFGSVFASILAMSALFAYSSDSHAEGWHHGGGHYVYRPGYGWVVPAVVGGVIGYEIARPAQPNVVIVQPQPVAPPPSAPYWPQPAGYHWEAILDAGCNCYRTVLVPN